MAFRAFLRPLAVLLLLLPVLLPPRALGAAVAPPPEAEVLATLRKLETARLRGTSDVLAREWEAQTRAKPKDPMPRIYKAWLAFPSDACWNELKAISVLHPENPWPHLGMGLIYVRWGLQEEARQSFAAALRESPDFTPALWGEALRLQAAGKYPEAEARFREALSRLDAPQLQAGLGMMLAQREGREAEARELLARSVEAWPEQPEVLEKLSQLALAAKDARTAARVGEQRVALRPNDREAHRRQADLWLTVAEREKAARSLERYIELGGSEPAVLATLVRVYAELGRAADEEQALRRLVGVELKDPEPVLRLAELAEARGEPAAVEALLVTATERAPQRGDLHVRRARWLLKQERPRDALEAYRAALAAPERRVPEADAEAAALVRRFRLPSTPARGSEDQIYSRVSLGLVALYMERLKEQPGLKGILKVRVRVDANGRATQVSVVQDSLKDVLIAGHAYFAFLDAQYPPGNPEPVFQYVFRPPK
jgi:Tfp pilus assembly protein PilF